MKHIRPATADDLDDVLTLLNTASEWLRSQGLDQWGRGFGPDQIGPMVDRREVYIVHDGDMPIATATASLNGDTDFWTPTELADNAAYLSKVTVARDRVGEGLGAMLFRWLVDRAARNGVDLVRLDVWRTNRGLHAYYDRTGWTYVRTVAPDHRGSGALFQKRAVLDHDAWMAFMYTGTTVNADARYAHGDRVVFDVNGRTEHGVVEASYGIEWTSDTYIAPAPAYVIQAESGRYERGHYEVRRPASRDVRELRRTA